MDFRQIALALPEALEQEHFGAPSFRVRGKIFAQLSAEGSEGLVKLRPLAQETLLLEHEGLCWAEPHWGKHGWTRLRWRELPSSRLEELIAQSWRAVAPKAVERALAGRVL